MQLPSVESLTREFVLLFDRSHTCSPEDETNWNVFCSSTRHPHSFCTVEAFNGKSKIQVKLIRNVHFINLASHGNARTVGFQGLMTFYRPMTSYDILKGSWNGLIEEHAETLNEHPVNKRDQPSCISITSIVCFIA